MRKSMVGSKKVKRIPIWSKCPVYDYIIKIIEIRISRKYVRTMFIKAIVKMYKLFFPHKWVNKKYICDWLRVVYTDCHSLLRNSYCYMQQNGWAWRSLCWGKSASPMKEKSYRIPLTCCILSSQNNRIRQ